MTQQPGYPPAQGTNWQPGSTPQPAWNPNSPSMPGLGTGQPGMPQTGGTNPGYGMPQGIPAQANPPSPNPFTPSPGQSMPGIGTWNNTTPANPMPGQGNIPTPPSRHITGSLNNGFPPPGHITGSLNNGFPPPRHITGALNNNPASPFPRTPFPANNNQVAPTAPKRHPSSVARTLLFLGLALLVISGGIIGVNLLQNPNGNSVTSAKAVVKPTPIPTPTPTVHMQHAAIAAKIVASMSLDDEIAQLLMVEHDAPSYGGDLDTMISQQHVGAVILYASAMQTRPQVLSDTTQMQTNAKIPLWISTDEEGRSLSRLQFIYGYKNYRKDADDIQATGDPGVATTEGQSVAKDLLSIGLNMNLAPVVDISGPNDYIGYDGRSFGTTADQVIKYAGPYIKAMQENGVVGTLKHFPGAGSIPYGFDPHAGLWSYTGTTDQLYQTDLVPFKHFIQDTDQYEKAYVVMPTDMLVPTIDSTYPAELSHTFITDILRNQLGFQGVILTDSLHMGGVQVAGQDLDLAQASVLAFEAGNDMLEGASTSDDVQAIITATEAAIQQGSLSKAQIDASVIRVLTLKMDFNVMPATMPQS